MTEAETKRREIVAWLREQANHQSVKLAALDAVPMSEPRQLSASHWGRESVINDGQCLQIFNAMLDAIEDLQHKEKNNG